MRRPGVVWVMCVPSARVWTRSVTSSPEYAAPVTGGTTKTPPEAVKNPEVELLVAVPVVTAPWPNAAATNRHPDATPETNRTFIWDL
jgi:hypothetical protein